MTKFDTKWRSYLHKHSNATRSINKSFFGCVLIMHTYCCNLRDIALTLVLMILFYIVLTFYTILPCSWWLIEQHMHNDWHKQLGAAQSSSIWDIKAINIHPAVLPSRPIRVWDSWAVVDLISWVPSTVFNRNSYLQDASARLLTSYILSYNTETNYSFNCVIKKQFYMLIVPIWYTLLTISQRPLNWFVFYPFSNHGSKFVIHIFDQWYSKIKYINVNRKYIKKWGKEHLFSVCRMWERGQINI